MSDTIGRIAVPHGDQLRPDIPVNVAVNTVVRLGFTLFELRAYVYSEGCLRALQQSTAERPRGGLSLWCQSTSRSIVLGIPKEDLKSIASILAAGYLRHRDQLRRAVPRLDCSETSSRHGHEVNGYENGERNGDRDAERD